MGQMEILGLPQQHEPELVYLSRAGIAVRRKNRRMSAPAEPERVFGYKAAFQAYRIDQSESAAGLL